MFSVYMAFGDEAKFFMEENDNDWDAAFASTDPDVEGRVRSFQFKTIDERNAFIEGVLEGAGWSDEPMYQTFDNIKTEDNAHTGN